MTKPLSRKKKSTASGPFCTGPPSGQEWHSITAIALDIEHELFGLGPFAAPITLGVVAETGNTTISDVVVSSTMTID